MFFQRINILYLSMREKTDTKLENLGKHGSGKDMEKASTREISRLGLFSLEKRGLRKGMTKRLIEVSYGLCGKSRKE